MTTLQLYASVKELIISLRKQGGSDYQPSSLRCLIVSVKRYLKKKRYGYPIINSIKFEGTREVLKAKQKALKYSEKGDKPTSSRSLADSEIDEL